MATLVVQQTPLRPSRSPPPGLSIETAKLKAGAVPNKHIPYCSPGPAPSTQSPATPPATPPTPESCETFPTSILHPADSYPKISSDPTIYWLDAATVNKAVTQTSTNPLADPHLVFPWLHGLHPENHIQQAFFIARRRALRKTPKCLRGITIVKAGGDLSKSKLRGAIAASELLVTDNAKDPKFLDVDPKEGFSVRNFQIQTAKMAMVSDIIVYKDDATKFDELKNTAQRLARAQKQYRERAEATGLESCEFNTFVVRSPFEDIEDEYPELVAISADGKLTGNVPDLLQLERQEMCTMSKASEIGRNIWLGPTPDSSILPQAGQSADAPKFDIIIEASDLARPPDSKTLAKVAEQSSNSTQTLDFPSSGSIMPPTWSHTEVDSLLEMCHWLFKITNPDAAPEKDSEGNIEEQNMKDSDGDIQMKSLPPPARKVLIHCADGYTETTLLALAYFMFAECIPVHEAWIRMHCEKKRNFFAYPSDVSLLTSIQPRLMQESPKGNGGIPSSLPEDPPWLRRLDGSLPSRILPYMYLGNLNHANNPELLKAMGIKRVLSVGEPVSWPKEKLANWGQGNFLYVDSVQDNGVDPLTDDIDRCLAFLEKGKMDGGATLVHCRVGVSRSATICIAEVMASLGLSFPRAYCFVRARRLNVIIQPHLRFAYELLKWEEQQQQKRGKSISRELEWATIAREIAAMNKPYTR